MGFFDSDRWNEILQTISRNRKRSIMTALGIFWGIFMLVVLLGAGQGLGRMARSSLGDMTVNSAFFIPDQTSIPYKGMPSDRSWRLSDDDVEAVRANPAVKYAGGVIFGGTHNCARGSLKGDYHIMGYTPEIHRHIHIQPLLYGRLLNDMDQMHKRKVCVIGTQVWKDLFPGGGDPSGSIIQVGGSYFMVVGVVVKKGMAELGSDTERTLFVPASLAQQLFGRGRTVDLLAVAGEEGLPNREVVDICRRTLFARHIIAPDDPRAAWVISTTDLLENVSRLFRGISLLTWIVGLGTLLAGVVGVSNIMLVTVKERTQEIGIRRALGAPPAAIVSQILSESFVLTFIAGVAGFAAAVGTLSLADSLYYHTMVATLRGPEITMQIPFGTGLLALFILVSGSLAAGIIPVVRALRIKAADAIREE